MGRLLNGQGVKISGVRILGAGLLVMGVALMGACGSKPREASTVPKTSTETKSAAAATEQASANAGKEGPAASVIPPAVAPAPSASNAAAQVPPSTPADVASLEAKASQAVQTQSPITAGFDTNHAAAKTSSSNNSLTNVVVGTGVKAVADKILGENPKMATALFPCLLSLGLTSLDSNSILSSLVLASGTAQGASQNSSTQVNALASCLGAVLK